MYQHVKRKTEEKAENGANEPNGYFKTRSTSQNSCLCADAVYAIAIFVFFAFSHFFAVSFFIVLFDDFDFILFTF